MPKVWFLDYFEILRHFSFDDQASQLEYLPLTILCKLILILSYLLWTFHELKDTTFNLMLFK